MLLGSEMARQSKTVLTLLTFICFVAPHRNAPSCDDRPTPNLIFDPSCIL